MYNAGDHGGSVTAHYVDVDGNEIALAVTFTVGERAVAFRSAGSYTATASIAA